MTRLEVSTLGGRLGDGRHLFPVRVYYEDTDATDFVYHGSYLRFAERARTEMLRALGDDHGGLREHFGIAFVVSKCDMHFRSPARLDDLIEVRTTMNGLGAATLDLQQDIWRGEQQLVRLRVVLACIDGVGRAVRIPAAVRGRLAAWGQESSRD